MAIGLLRAAWPGRVETARGPFFVAGFLAARLLALASEGVSRAAAAVRRPTLAELLSWHLFLLAPTLAFKTAYLQTIWPRQKLWADGTLLGAEGHLFPSLIAAARLFASDVLGLAAFVLGLWLLGARGVRLRLARLAAMTLVLAVVLGGATWVCLHESGGFLTPELATIAWCWVRDNPAMLLQFHPVRISALILVAVIWALALGWMLRRSGEGKRGPLRLPATLSAAAIAAAVLVSTMPSTRSPDASVARRGFWPAALEALGTTTMPSQDTAPLPPGAARLASATRDLVYPNGRPVDAGSIADLSSARLVPRHVVMIILETAAREYYPLTDNPDFPTFAAMSRQAIVSDRHYSTRPLSLEANYSALSGVYPPSLNLGNVPPASPTGLASVLSKHGYDATYIDAHWLDWRGGDRERRLLTNLGFARLIELESKKSPKSFAARVSREEQAFHTAVEQIEAAARDGRKALVVIATTLGHFQWQSRPEHRHLPNDRKLYEIARVADRLTKQLLDGLTERKISDVVIVVTGDHGLRFAKELASLGEEQRQAAVRFNVPFLLYAPGLFTSQIRLPYPTSHVDITPTLLHLVGVPTHGLLHHGENMLDPALSERAVFLLNARFAPFDYVVWKEHAYELNHLTGRITVEAGRTQGDTLSTAQVRAMFDAATQAFDRMALRFAGLRDAPNGP